MSNRREIINEEILTELQRQIKLPCDKRPLMGVLIADPEHKPGGWNIPLKLAALGTMLNEQGTISSVTATFRRTDGLVISASYPINRPEDPSQRGIMALRNYSLW